MFYSFSQRPEEEEEFDEEEEEHVGLEPTEMLCGSCQEFIQLREDITVIHLSMPYIDIRGEVVFTVLLDDEGEPQAEPLFYGYECWENVGQELAECLADAPPVEEDGALLTCDFCNSSVRMGEKCATIHLGEFIKAERQRGRSGPFFSQPAPEPGSTFLPADEIPGVICLSCVQTMVTNVSDRFAAFGMWDHVSQNGECRFCTTARCWRIGRCMCDCHVRPEVG